MTQTFDKIKYGARLAASATFSFIKINLIGSISTVLFAFVTFIVLTNQCFGAGPGPGHVSGYAFLMVLFSLRPVASTLTVCILSISPFILFALGNKYILMKTTNKVIKEKGESLLYPLVDSVLNKVKQKQPELLKKGVDTAKLKMKILHEIKESNDNKWVKRITTFGLNKANLNEIDFGNENLSFTEIIKIRIVSSLQNISKPSKTFFLTILVLQWFVFLLIILKVV